MSEDAPLYTPLSALSPEEYSRLVSFYYSCSEEQDDPLAWRSENPLWSWDPELIDDGNVGFSLGLDPVSPDEGPSGFLKFIFGDVLPEGKRALLWSFRRRGAPRSARRSHWIRRLDRLPDLVPDCDWYFGPGLPGPGQEFNDRERVKVADVVGIPCLWADIDIAHPAHNSDKVYPPDMDSAVEFLMNLPAPPTVMVDTGHGLHAYWCLTDLWLFGDGEGHAAGVDLALRWHLMIASQLANYGWETDKVADLARVLRLPGTLNIKEEDDQPLVELMPWRGRRYHLWELDAICHGFVAVDADGAPDLGADSKSGSSAGSDTSEAGAKPGKDNGSPSSGSLNRELSDAAKAAIVQHYFGDVKPDGRGERRCGDIEGAASRHGDSGVGSFSISAEGLWRDFATDEGGDVIDLIMAREEIPFGKVRPWLERQGHLPSRAVASRDGKGKGGGGRGRNRPQKEPVDGRHGQQTIDEAKPATTKWQESIDKRELVIVSQDELENLKKCSSGILEKNNPVTMVSVFDAKGIAVVSNHEGTKRIEVCDVARTRVELLHRVQFVKDTDEGVRPTRTPPHLVPDVHLTLRECLPPLRGIKRLPTLGMAVW